MNVRNAFSRCIVIDRSLCNLKYGHSFVEGKEEDREMEPTYTKFISHVICHTQNVKFLHYTANYVYTCTLAGVDIAVIFHLFGDTSSA